MYGIIREGNGKYYTSMVFGYYQSTDRYDYKNRFWIVLNKEKNTLVKQPVIEPNTKYLIPTVLITDANQCNWNKESDYAHSVDFLPTDTLPAMIDTGTVPEALTQRCIELDQAYRFEEIRDVRTADDIRDLEWASGGFHDAYISQQLLQGDTLYVLFDGTWGCKVEVWFEGDVEYDTASRDPETMDPYWFGSKVIIQEGFIYLIDDDNAELEHLKDGYCWFKARNMKYRIIPD